MIYLQGRPIHLFTEKKSPNQKNQPTTQKLQTIREKKLLLFPALGMKLGNSRETEKNKLKWNVETKVL